MFQLIKKHPHVLFFCGLIMFFTGLGQTFLLGQYLPELKKSYGLIDSEVSGIYGIATFLASLMLSYFGGLLDRVSLKKFTLGVIFFIMCGGLTIAYGRNVILLFIGFLFLRGLGQMTLGLISITTIGKVFGRNRGKALVIAAFGRNISEAMLPYLLVTFMALWGWSHALSALFVGMFFILGLASFSLIPKISSDTLYDENKSSEVSSTDAALSWRWKDFLGRPKVLALSLFNAMMPFVVSALYFQQATIASNKNWTMELLAKSFIALSVCQLLASLLGGHLIDRFGAKKVFPLYIIPYTGALIAVYMIDSSLGSYLYLGLLGTSIGLKGHVRGALWAELFGTKNLGRINSMDAQLTAIGTALSPFLLSKLFETGLKLKTSLEFFIICAILAFGFYLWLWLDINGKKRKN